MAYSQRVQVEGDPLATPVPVSGTVTAVPTGTQTVAGTVTANQGTPAATANAWPTKVGNGSANADVAPTSPASQGNALLVATGPLTAGTTLSAASAPANGTTIDYGCAKANVTLVVTASAGVSAGTVALEVSQDNTNWYRHTTTISTTAPGVSQVTLSASAFRYCRGVITVAITGGTVSATIMATG